MENYKLSEAWSLSTKASLQVRDAVGGGNTVNTISRSILTPPTTACIMKMELRLRVKEFLLSEADCMKIYYKTNYDDTNVYRTTFQLGAIWKYSAWLDIKAYSLLFRYGRYRKLFQADNETTGNTIRPASAKHNFDSISREI
jgi:hypothetical protein